MRSQYTQSRGDVALNAHLNTGPGTNTFVFGILTILMQIAICIVYGILIKSPAYESTDPVGPVDFTNITITILFFFFVLLGFACLFGYLKKLVWSALGFNLLIVCLTVEWYFLINLFWLKTGIRGLFSFSSGIDYNNIFLTNSQFYTIQAETTGLQISAMGQSLTDALKCSIANMIGFSAILGRAGPLEAFLISMFGTVGYTLCRHIVQYLHFDYGDCFTVFVFGGFMSLMIGIFLRCKESDLKTTEKNLRYTGSLFAGAISFFGGSMLYATFPMMVADPQRSFLRAGVLDPTQLLTTAQHAFYTVPFSIWYSMSAAVIVGCACSIFVYQKAVPRDFLNSLVAGGVASCTAGLYFTNPVWPMVLGSTAGGVQSLIQGLIEKRVSMTGRIFHSNSFSLFGVQGLIGGVFASIFRKVVETRTDGLTYDFTYHYFGSTFRYAGFDLAMACLCAAFGLAFGILIGIFMLCTGKHQSLDHFDDYTYWVPDDGIRYPRQVPDVIPPGPIITPVVPQTPIPIQEIYVKETVVNVKAKHAYL